VCARASLTFVISDASTTQMSENDASRIVIDDSRVTLTLTTIEASLTIVCIIFIVQATWPHVMKLFTSVIYKFLY
jgi:hypothetical protein